MGKVIAEIVIENYIEEVELSKARRKQYYTSEAQIKAKKYKDRQKYQFKKVGKRQFLYDVTTNERVIKNSRSAGTPRTKRIRGQDVWEGIDYNLRSKIGKELKKYLYSKIQHIKPLKSVDYPIGVALEFHTQIGDFDLDNLEYWYRKCLHDCLGGNVEFYKKKVGGKFRYFPDRKKYPPKIADDSVRYIVSKPCDFYEIEEGESRYLVIKIFKVEDDRRN